MTTQASNTKKLNKLAMRAQVALTCILAVASWYGLDTLANFSWYLTA